MPEGHTIHRVAKDHGSALVGDKLVATSPQGRFAEGARELSGRTLEKIDAVGKHLLYHWRGPRRTWGPILHVHLGLYGKFRLHRLEAPSGSPTGPRSVPEPRGAVRLRLVGPRAAFDLNGPTCCELIDEAQHTALLERLGPDPLRKDADPERAWNRISKSRTGIGALLMNQSVIAGVGNIYRCEVLHLEGIHPDRPGKELLRCEFDAIWERLVELMRIGVRHNRIIISDPADIGKPRGRMTRDERLRIYKKSACPGCGGAIAEWQIAGRKVFACQSCQS
ncbi:Fpg/Nei family DNA glycosylase [Botrimarina hoheduenensis]|uniref:DNA-(apurinic or apyrimidinic site) lyase n=1 Tax=Botrimarina hoheduenensis TaxID=2528000 RepID=A0A5C5VXH4_9BACT|nr:DNA-formamidopyrimidine glycosylase family protein [Botrimarina hoheduenensis]TWT43338.1 Endonuclease 8 1 [Botrimarina hoheduenensis]